MKFTNFDIYNITNSYQQAFGDFKSYIPAKANFYIQKNIKAIAEAAQAVEEARLQIATHYGVSEDNGATYKIPEDALPQATQELNELFAIEQDLDIKKFNIEDLGSAEFTPAQMQILMFMIED